MINLILYISILASAAMIVYYFFSNIRMNKAIKAHENELMVFEKEAEEHKAKMKLRPKKVVPITEADIKVNRTQLKDLNQQLIDVLYSILNDPSMKKSYKETAESLRNELLRREGRQDETVVVDAEQEDEGVLSDQIVSVFSKLTKNELTLCVMLLQGKSTKEIAEATNREVRSVESSRNRLRKKLELENGADLREFLVAKMNGEQ